MYLKCILIIFLGVVCDYYMYDISLAFKSPLCLNV